jgi:hypothetical protein
MKGTRERQTYVPGGYSGGFWGGYYGAGWGYDPGYMVTDTFVNFETTLWDPHGEGKMVWSAVTETENPSSSSDFIAGLSKSIIPALVQARLLPPAVEPHHDVSLFAVPTSP